MRGERGQATVEWIGILLLVALALAALTRLSARADGQALATTLAHSITHPRTPRSAPGTPARTPPGPAAKAFLAPPLVPAPGGFGPRARPKMPGIDELARRVRRLVPRGLPARGQADRVLAQRVRRGAGAAWRRAWYACLVYERFRWAFLHPESRFPGYTMPPAEVLRIMNDCISPVDLVRDWPMLSGRAP
jgi:hypothetical protein